MFKCILTKIKIENDKGLCSRLLASIRPGTMLTMESKSFGWPFAKVERRQKKWRTRKPTPKRLRPPTFVCNRCNILVEHLLRTMAFGFSARLITIQLSIWLGPSFKDLQLWIHEQSKTRKRNWMTPITIDTFRWGMQPLYFNDFFS